jgi:hypothetical protein
MLRQRHALTDLQAMTAPDFARIDFRTYGTGNWDPGMNNIAPTTEFTVGAGTFTSYWVYVDWSTNQWSMWAADAERREPVQVMRQYTMIHIGAIDPFIIQFNSSQNGGDFPEPVGIGCRDFVYLKDLPAAYDDALALLADPTAQQY